jgi:hypothetical protein
MKDRILYVVICGLLAGWLSLLSPPVCASEIKKLLRDITAGVKTRNV